MKDIKKFFSTTSGKVASIVVALVICIIVFAIISSSKNQTSAPAAVTTSVPAVSQPASQSVSADGFVSTTSAQFGVKTEVMDGVYLTISKPQNFTESNAGLQPSAGNKDISIHVSFDNESDGPISINPADFTVVDSSGNSYQIAAADDSPDLNSETVNQNNLASGNVVFAVPDTIPTAQFIVHYESDGYPQTVVDFSGSANSQTAVQPVIVKPVSVPIVQSVTPPTSQPVTVQTPPPPVTYQVDITLQGTGSGTITSSPAGISCDTVGSCSGTFPTGTVVTFTATPTSGSAFAGWSTVDDSCIGTGTCKLTMSGTPGPFWVLATFNPPAPSPFTISGSGNSASRQFTLQSGLVVFNMQYSGTANFIVHLLDNQGNQVGMSLANVIGNYNGSQAMNIDSAGTYLFNVQASGSWSIAVSQPQPSGMNSVSTLSGYGDKATDFFYLSQGLHTFTLSNNGQRNFIVHLLDNQGNDVGMSLANVIGSYNGSQAIHVDENGSYLLDVQSDGSWTVGIQ